MAERDERALEHLIDEMRDDRVAADAREERIIRRNTEHLDDVGSDLRAVRDSIRADAEAILAMLDRLRPAPGC
jgi:hypothetical protein